MKAKIKADYEHQPYFSGSPLADLKGCLVFLFTCIRRGMYPTFGWGLCKKLIPPGVVPCPHNSAVLPTNRPVPSDQIVPRLVLDYIRQPK